MSQKVTRAEVEDFLFREADLLDDWKLAEWLGLFTDDARYLVPSVDLPADASPDTSLFYIADDAFRLEQRVARLSEKSGHSEWPRSKTRHFISNVRVGEQVGDRLEAVTNFIVIRARDGRVDRFWGRSIYALVRHEDGFRIQAKRCMLDMENLLEQGRISILL